MERTACGQAVVTLTYPEEQVRRAASNGIELLRQSTDRYPSHRDCFSCHHQSLPLAVLRIHASNEQEGPREHNAERDKIDWGVDQRRIEQILALSRASLQRQLDALREGEELDGRGLTLGYALWTLELGQDDDMELRNALVSLALDSQCENGSWQIHSHRPPAASSELMATALICAGLTANQHRHPKETAANDALCRARWWVWNQPIPETVEDLVGMLGCVRVLEQLDFPRKRISSSNQGSVKSPWESWTDIHVPRDQFETLEQRRGEHDAVRLMQSLWIAQNPDGGWGQTKGEDSDAYATGISLNAILDSAGRFQKLHAEEPRLANGLRWLLQNQCPDGSWHVSSRCIPVQEYFDNGDPHETDQFISIMGTAWATAALCRASCDFPDLLLPNLVADVRETSKTP